MQATPFCIACILQNHRALSEVSRDCRPEVAYSKHVQENGIYLHLLDLAVMCNFYSKNGSVIYYDSDEIMPPRSFADLITKVIGVPGDSDFCLHQSDISKASAEDDTWVFVCCRADFEAAGILNCNHWLTAWHYDVLGEADWNLRRSTFTYEITESILACTKHIKSLGTDAEDAEIVSAMMQLELLQRKQQCFEAIMKQKFMPVDVPADGNCGVWSVLSFKQGSPDASCNDLALQQKERESLQKAWEAVADNELWQRIFWLCDLQMELPAEVLKECAFQAAQDPSTPQRQSNAAAHMRDAKKSPIKHLDPKKINECRPATFGQRKCPIDGILRKAEAPAKSAKKEKKEAVADCGEDADSGEEARNSQPIHAQHCPSIL